MATAASPSSWKAPSHSHSNSRSSRPMTTPRANHPISTPSTQIKSTLSPTARTPHIIKDMKNPSPSYFGFVVGDESVPGPTGTAPASHARQNWNEYARGTPRPGNNERNLDFELFRRQSEKNIGFALNSLPQTRTNSFDVEVLPSPDQSSILQSNTRLGKLPGDSRDREQGESSKAKVEPQQNPFFLGAQRQDSPLSLSPRDNVTGSARDSRLSLPAHDIQAVPDTMRAQRSDTLPPQSAKETYVMSGPQEVAQAIELHPDKVLILDLRVFPQYAASHVRGALNLCIPTTLLKRPTFTVQKLTDTFTSDSEKAKFNKWRIASYIVVYDGTSSLAKEATTSFNVLKKFATEGWQGTGLVVKGGFAGIQKLAPRLVEQGGKASVHGPDQQKLAVAGGCQMPTTQNAANPFFGNIRQNMDLLDGVGQLPIKRPAGLKDGEENKWPTWLQRAASVSNEGKEVSDKFLHIEKSEQSRMQQALSGSVSYGTPGPQRNREVQVAGIEKGSKNRYNNIFPFEHSRVRLQNVPSHGCDYFNASFVKASYSNRKYIATQAPIPGTFDDFWKVVWEQDVRVVVMLTAESEGGQVKSHTYWRSGDYGSIKVKQLAEKKILLTSEGTVQREQVQRKTSTGRRLTTSSATPVVEKRFNFQPAEVKAGQPPKADEEPSVIVRHFTVSYPSQPSKPSRDITQLQYTQWPDFGAPTNPLSILSLVNLVSKYQRSASSPRSLNPPGEPVNEGQSPIIVHCSAGCGRTGTFCTIDSVIDMLKRQREMRNSSSDIMNIDTEDDWVQRDDVDLVAKTVEDFRRQRLSMVQNLRQFVLCYESILQWTHDEK